MRNNVVNFTWLSEVVTNKKKKSAQTFIEIIFMPIWDRTRLCNRLADVVTRACGERPSLCEDLERGRRLDWIQMLC